MEGDVQDAEMARYLARDYADENCVGELGEILDVRYEESVWRVEFRTHTFADEYDHRVRIAPVGNVFGHERTKRSE